MKAALFATLLLLTACTSGMSPEEIEAKVLEANTGINHYKVDSIIKITSEAQGQTLNMDMDMIGEINREERKGHVSSKTSMSLGSFQTSIDQEVYIVDDYVYTSVLDNWVKVRTENAWDDQDQVEQYTLMLDNGEMEIVGTETIEGTEYYVVDMTLGREFLNQYLASTSNDEQFEGVDFSDYDITFYINTETFVIERNTGKLSVSQDVNGETISMDMDIESTIYDINTPNNIEVPEEALQAEDYGENYKGSY